MHNEDGDDEDILDLEQSTPNDYFICVGNRKYCWSKSFGSLEYSLQNVESEAFGRYFMDFIRPKGINLKSYKLPSWGKVLQLWYAQ